VINFSTILCFILSVDGVRINYELSLRTEARVRPTTSLDVDEASRPIAGDALLQPSGLLRFDFGRVQLNLSYHPQLIMPEPYARFHLDVQHQADGGLQWRVVPKLSLRITQTAAYGASDFRSLNSLLSSQTNRLEPIPLQNHLTYESSYTALASDITLTPHLVLNALADYFIFGGVTRQDQQSLPLQNTPHGEISIRAAVAPQQHFSQRIAGGESEFTGLQKTKLYWIQDEARWEKQFSGNTQLKLSAGVQGSSTKNDHLPLHWQVFPSLQSEFNSSSHTPYGNVSLKLLAQVSPFLDRIVAVFYERVEASAILSWEVKRKLNFSLQGFWSVAIFNSVYGGQQLDFGQSTVTYMFHRNFNLDFGVRSLWERSKGESYRTAWIPQWVGFAALTVHSEGRF